MLWDHGLRRHALPFACDLTVQAARSAAEASPRKYTVTKKGVGQVITGSATFLSHGMDVQGGGALRSDFQPMTSADLSPEPQEQGREQRPEPALSGIDQPAAASHQADSSAPAQVQAE